jgi:hypothetical protein
MQAINTPEDTQYEASVAATLKSAAAVCNGLHQLGASGHLKILWFVPAYGLGAVLVLFSTRSVCFSV